MAQFGWAYVECTASAGGASVAYAAFSSSFIVSASYDVIGVNCSAGVITASLPLVSGLTGGKRFVFKDITGSAGTNAIAIEPSGSDVVDGSTSGVVINVNYGAVTLAADSVGEYYIIGIRD
jgi:hypothetical protein